MTRRALPQVSADFAEVLSFLRARAIVPEKPSSEQIVVARQIHDSTYSLILWKFRLRGLPDHSMVFIEEIASDALQVLPQVMMGYGKTAKLLIRGIVENAFRHIYFSDHPIEFARMNREQRWFLTIEELRDYAKAHPDYLKTERKFDAIDRLTSLYSELSGGVHGRTVRDLEMRSALQRIRYSQPAATLEATRIKRCAEAVNFLLAIFHFDKVRRFQSDDRRIILHSMPRPARVVWSEHE